MSLFSTISYWLNLIFGILFTILIVVGGLVFYFFKIKKVTAKEETVDYGSFRRTDSLDYVKFDNIETEKYGCFDSPGIIHMGNNVFIAGLSVSGYSFATASDAEREKTMLGAITFFNSVDAPVQFRQTAHAVDLSDTIAVYEEIVGRLTLEGAVLEEEYEKTLRKAEDCIGSEDYEIYDAHLRMLQRKINAKKHSVDEAKELMRYERALSTRGSSGTQKVHQFLYSWTYNPDETVEELPKEEIRLQAFLELKSIGKKYIDAYSNCGYIAKRLSAEQVTMEMYKQMRPLTSDDVRMEDVFETSYESLFITSDSLLELEKSRMGEEAFERRMEEYQQAQEEPLYQQSLQDEKERQELFDSAHAQAVAESA